MEKISLLFSGIGLVFVGVLCSCANNESVTGKYAFQLGSSNSTNVGMSLTLSEEVCAEDPKQNKAFTLEIHNSSAEVPTSTSGASLYNPNYFDPDSSTDKEGFDLTGIHYDLSEEDGDLDLSNLEFSGSYDLENIDSTNLIHFNVYKVIQDIEIEIPDEFIKYLITATLTGNTVTIVIPVSVNDLVKQVAWKSAHEDDPLAVPDPSSEDYYHTVSFPLVKE